MQSMTSYTATLSTQGQKNILVRSIHLHMRIMKSTHKIKQLPLIKDLGIQNDNYVWIQYLLLSSYFGIRVDWSINKTRITRNYYLGPHLPACKVFLWTTLLTVTF